MGGGGIRNGLGHQSKDTRGGGGGEKRGRIRSSEQRYEGREKIDGVHFGMDEVIRDTIKGGRTGCVWEWITLRNKGVWDWDHVMSCWSCVHF